MLLPVCEVYGAKTRRTIELAVKQSVRVNGVVGTHSRNHASITSPQEEIYNLGAETTVGTTIHPRHGRRCGRVSPIESRRPGRVLSCPLPRRKHLTPICAFLRALETSNVLVLLNPPLRRMARFTHARRPRGAVVNS